MDGPDPQGEYNREGRVTHSPRMELLEALVEAGADLEAKDHSGQMAGEDLSSRGLISEIIRGIRASRRASTLLIEEEEGERARSLALKEKKREKKKKGKNKKKISHVKSSDAAGAGKDTQASYFSADEDCLEEADVAQLMIVEAVSDLAEAVFSNNPPLKKSPPNVALIDDSQQDQRSVQMNAQHRKDASPCQPSQVVGKVRIASRKQTSDDDDDDDDASEITTVRSRPEDKTGDSMHEHDSESALAMQGELPAPTVEMKNGAETEPLNWRGISQAQLWLCSGKELDRLKSEALMALELINEEQKARAQEMPDEYLCPITQDVMEDPVIAMDGHTYERKAIEEWLLTRDTSPMTNMTLPSKMLVPNLAVRSMIAEKGHSRI